MNGYVLTQITDDRQYGAIVGADGARTTVFAIGPALHADMRKAGIDLKILRVRRAQPQPGDQCLDKGRDRALICVYAVGIGRD
ncbi:transporter [Sphingobium sp. H39-3-25]|uniref:Uncharacterized protein n=1 Tax=Sphingopyxis fribergensis TaxID=1515612 RepID=A0A0A7PD33_9SPHN|nr:transporter [Sphingopyxis fribergensis]AJA07093.1 hypothetical protein SKP52_00755 [Sphingopyxis fribergensis]MDF0545742.1 transporter [Sphingobium arseniciresistens]